MAAIPFQVIMTSMSIARTKEHAKLVVEIL